MRTPLRRRAHDFVKAFRHAWGLVKGAIWLPSVADVVGREAMLIGRNPVVVNRGRMHLGRNFRARSVIMRSQLETGPEGILSIGDDVFINQGTCIYAACSVTIGSRVDIGDLVRIYDTNFHPTKPGDTTKTLPVVIEDDVWLASGCVILPGVVVGRGAVVAAGAIVTKNVPAGSVVAGRASSTVDVFDVPPDYRRRDFQRRH